MTSSITMAEQEGTGAQERHWQPVPCPPLVQILLKLSGTQSFSLSQSLGVMKSGHAALLSTTEPGSGWRSELKMFLPPTLSLHLHLVLDLPTAIPFPFKPPLWLAGEPTWTGAVP